MYLVLAEKPVISDDSNQLDPSLLDELLANIATLSSVYHKPPEAFVTRTKTATPKTEENDYPDGSEALSELLAHQTSSVISPPSSSSQAPVPDLLGDFIGLDNSNALVPVDEQLEASPPLPVLLPPSAGQGLQISSQLIRKDGNVFYSMSFENNTQVLLDGFMIQFNKNTFGLAAGAPLQVPALQPGTSAHTLLPMNLFQNIAPGPPNSLLQVAVKNNQQPVWYFSDKISLHVLFMEDGRMERTSFLETWKSLPDSNEVLKDFPGLVINSVEATLDKLALSNMFFIAKRKNANQEVLYLSAKIPRGTPILIELTSAIGVLGVKCAIKTPAMETAPLFFEALEHLLKD